MAYQIGDLVQFSYESSHKRVGKAGRHDKFPKVLVLHPNWKGLTHGLNFNYLSNDEVNILRMLFDPMFEMKYRDALRSRNPNIYDELERILTGKSGSGGGLHRVHPPGFPSGTVSRITKPNSPRAFYYNIIRPFIYRRGWDPYRKYVPLKMKNSRVITPASVMTGEDSLVKFKKERQDMMTRAKKALDAAKTKQDKDLAKAALEKIKKEKHLSQRQSLLTWFSNALQHWRGPRFR